MSPNEGPIDFGEQTRQKCYHFESPDTVYLNQGSYGPCPTVVLDELFRLRRLQEINPDRWFRQTKTKLYMENVNAAAKWINCDPNSLAIIDNVTIGINAVLKSALPCFANGNGTILCTSLAYGSVRYTVEQAAIQHGMHVHTVDVHLPITSKQELIAQFEDAIKQCAHSKSPIRFAIIDHISSATAILLPIDELTDLFHNNDIMVMIDGAHAPGQVYLSLDMSTLKCDFYAGNFHKWNCTARGCAFLFVRDPQMAALIRPAVTSWGYYPSPEWPDMSHFHVQFFNQGTRDESALFTLTRALQFIENEAGGIERIHSYNSRLSQQAKDTLEKLWQTVGCDLAIEELRAPYMKLVRLPPLRDYPKTQIGGLQLLNDLISKHNIIAAVIHIQDELYVRLSTQIYNSLQDYEVFGRKIMELAVCEDAFGK